MKTKMIFASLMMVVLLTPVIAFANNQFTITDQNGNKIDLTAWNIAVKQNVQIKSLGSIPSSIKITNPYAAPGQVVQAQITVTNQGGPYPFNFINLPPNQFALFVSVDRSNDLVTCSDNPTQGRLVWSFLSSSNQRVSLEQALQLAKNSFGVTWAKQSAGRSCNIVDVLNDQGIPSDIRSQLSAFANQQVCKNLLTGATAQKFITYDCLKVIDDADYRQYIQGICPNGVLDNNCLNVINSLTASNSSTIAIGDSVSCMLTSDPIGSVTGINSQTHMASCGIGTGLNPGQSATFNFDILVPTDTPLASADLSSSIQNIQTGPYTQLSDCSQTSSPQGCHQLYVAVAPVAQQNFIKGITSWFNNLQACSGSASSNIFSVVIASFIREIIDPQGYNSCWQTQTQQQPIGQPIAEDSGIFFVFGPLLGFSINLMLVGAVIGGIGVGILGRRF